MLAIYHGVSAQGAGIQPHAGIGAGSGLRDFAFVVMGTFLVASGKCQEQQKNGDEQ
jgi:hypothetical protein